MRAVKSSFDRRRPNCKEDRERDFLNRLLIVGSILYFLSILWINFHSRQWYSFDIYSDSLLARIMAEQKTIFPDNWVFGNQYYVIATPVLAALIYALCHNSVLALAVASSIMMGVVILTYVWALGPFLEKREKLVGVFCLSGAIILGNSASSYVNGLEYFYTMASFYACYVFVIFITLGICFRLQIEKKVNFGILIISFLLSFALGMQSLRETLVLYLPLLACAILMLWVQKNERKCALYAALLLVANIAGVLVMKVIPVKSAPIIGEVSLTLKPKEIFENLKITSQEFLNITGLRFCTYGVKWILLFGIAMLSFLAVLFAIIGVVGEVIKSKEYSVIQETIVFLYTSVLAVFVVGVFLFRIRAIYFFVWYLLVAVSFIYDVREYRKVSKYIILCLGFIGMVNYIMNFYPDFSKFKAREEFYQKTTEKLVDKGIDCIYYDVHTSPLFAVYSNDQIISGTVQLDPTEKCGGLMHPVGYLQPVDVFKNAGQYNSYIVFSNWTFDYLGKNASAEYIEKLMSSLEYVEQVSYQNEEFTFYRISPEILNYSD